MMTRRTRALAVGLATSGWLALLAEAELARASIFDPERRIVPTLEALLFSSSILPRGWLGSTPCQTKDARSRRNIR